MTVPIAALFSSIAIGIGSILAAAALFIHNISKHMGFCLLKLRFHLREIPLTGTSNIDHNEGAINL
jgi:hypothetical protein